MGDGGDDRAARDGPIRRVALTPGLRYLWALPASALGLILSLGFDRRTLRDGLLLAEGARWPRRLGWRYRAITFGHVVLSVDEMDDDTWSHELVHCRQFERWGIFMFVSYPCASLWARVRGRHHYRDNPFEVAARRGPTERKRG